MQNPLFRTSLLLVAPALLLTNCASVPDAPALPASQEAFWEALSSHCGADGDGRAYAGSLTSSDARDADMVGKRMVAHWGECSDTRVAVAFHIEDAEAPAASSSSGAVGRQESWDRSRTWVITRTSEGLRLKHDHRHDDGSEDAVTQYGGDTLSAGTARVQDFPVDAYSIAMFEREGLDLSLTNVWRVEVDPAGERGAKFVYQLTRRNDPTRLFRVEFDAEREVAVPVAAWGW